MKTKILILSLLIFGCSQVISKEPARQSKNDHYVVKQYDNVWLTQNPVHIVSGYGGPVATFIVKNNTEEVEVTVYGNFSVSKITQVEKNEP